MPFIEADLGQDYEDKPVAEGRYDLRVKEIQEKSQKNGAPMTLVIIEIEGEEGAGVVFHNLLFPIGKKIADQHGIEPDDARIIKFKMQQLTRFLHLFNVPFEKKGFNTEDLLGATASQVPLTQGEFEGIPKNEIKLPAVPH